MPDPRQPQRRGVEFGRCWSGVPPRGERDAACLEILGDVTASANILTAAFGCLPMVLYANRFSYDIGSGLTAGLLLYPLVRAAAGQARELSAGAWVLGGIGVLSFFSGCLVGRPGPLD